MYACSDELVDVFLSLALMSFAAFLKYHTLSEQVHEMSLFPIMEAVVAVQDGVHRE